MSFSIDSPRHLDTQCASSIRSLSSTPQVVSLGIKYLEPGRWPLYSLAAMSLRILFQSATWQQPLAAVVGLALLLSGVLPVLHDHESSAGREAACHGPVSENSFHLETLELGPNELCGFCARTFSATGLDRPMAAIVDEVGVGEASGEPQLLPESPPRRYGASRAPPIA